MISNRCTYGADFACGNHGREFETTPYSKPGAVTRTTKYSGTAPWRKHGTERKVKARKLTKLQSALLTCATRKIIYDLPTVCRRQFPKEA